jgi:hypothetical protein
MLARDTNIGDWNLPPPGRGGRDSNGNEHLGMFAVAGSPAEDSSTSGTPVRSTPVHLQYHPPTPPLPRSAPYIEKDLRSSNRNGYSYDFMIADLDAEAQSMHHEPLSPILEEAEEPTPIVTQPTKNTFSKDKELYITRTILAFEHTINRIQPTSSILGYISYSYDFKPMERNVQTLSRGRLTFSGGRASTHSRIRTTRIYTYT